MRYRSAALLAVWGTVFSGAPFAAGQESAGVQANLNAYMADKVTDSMLLDGVRIGGQLVVVGEHGHILVSTDDGKSWQQQTVPTRSALTGVAFANETLGYAVGHDAVILRTTDGGQSWERVYFDPDYQTPLLHVWAPTAQRAVAIGAYGLYLETLDGGDTWEQRAFRSKPLPLADDVLADEVEADEPADATAADDEDDWAEEDYGEDYHLNKIVRADDGTLYIAGEAGSLYRSDDNGDTWYRLEPPYEGSFFGVLPLEGDSLLAFGMRGNLFRSDDRGLGFRQLDTDVDALLTSAIRGQDNSVVLVGLAGVVLHSEDGETFELYRQTDRKGAMTALPAADGSIVLVGEAGVKRLSQAAYRAGGQP